MRRNPRPSPAQYARAWACPVPLGPNSASLHTAPPGAQSRQRLRACRWCLPPRLGLVARRRAVRGPPPFATLYNGPQAARRWRGLPGARGAARSRPRVALVCAALGPPRRNARRGVPKPSKVCAKNPHCAPPRVPPPPWGALGPVAWLGGFCARVPIRRHPLPPRLLVVVVGGSGFPPPAAGPAPRECRGREGFARSRPVAPLGLLPARFFLSRPLHSRWRAGFFPFALAVSCRSCSLHGGPPWAGRAALAGGTVYRRC